MAVALLMGLSAFASNRGSLQLSANVTINGTQLSAGEYAVKWEGNGPDVQVSIMKGKEVVATAPAHVVDLTKPSVANTATLSKNPDGSNSLSEIRFGGKKFALAFSGVSTQSQLVIK